MIDQSGFYHRTMTTTIRDYASLAKRMTSRRPREQAMQEVVDLLWDALHHTGVSWVGFYIEQSDRPEHERLVLGPSRNSPACSPIGLHGVCGQALTQRATRIVDDVRTLGPDYIACDPNDRSEIVIPLFDQHGRCWGVLDLDSREVGSFQGHDEEGLQSVLLAAGLTMQ